MDYVVLWFTVTITEACVGSYHINLFKVNHVIALAVVRNLTYCIASGVIISEPCLKLLPTCFSCFVIADSGLNISRRCAEHCYIFKCLRWVKNILTPACRMQCFSYKHLLRDTDEKCKTCCLLGNHDFLICAHDSLACTNRWWIQ